MENIVLIGMPSSGKSTVGVILAKKLGLGFIDCDLLIQGEEGKLLSEIIEERGSEGFLQVEERVCAGLACSRCVIATGGSAVYSEKAMRSFAKSGKIVYLKVEESEVEKRVGSFVQRGVVMRGNVSTLKELYDQRVPLYEKFANIIIDCNGKNIDQTVESVIKAVRS